MVLKKDGNNSNDREREQADGQKKLTAMKQEKNPFSVIHH